MTSFINDGIGPNFRVRRIWYRYPNRVADQSLQLGTSRLTESELQQLRMQENAIQGHGGGLPSDPIEAFPDSEPVRALPSVPRPPLIQGRSDAPGGSLPFVPPSLHAYATGEPPSSFFRGI
jgi:hypothetical protein